MATSNGRLTKRQLARVQGCARSSLYYEPRQPAKDWSLKIQIEHVLHEHPSYGHRRLALHLGVNRKRARRVMRLYGLKPYRRRGKKYRKPGVPAVWFPNLLQTVPFPDRSEMIWVSDFTHLSFHGRFVYLATVMDLYAREVVGWSLSTGHSVTLVLSALIDAVEKRPRPGILHSDQGAEYTSRVYTRFADGLGIQLSMSRKASPWENGYQESFYDKFKVDFGDPNRFASLGELTAEVYQAIRRHNHERIHTTLKMPPALYAMRQRIFTLHPTLATV